MEINITKFFNESDAHEYSGSRMERGDNAAQETWSNAVSAASDSALLKTKEELQAMRDWAKSSGGWDAEEIAAWSDTEVNALFIQFVSSEIRQIESLCSDDNGETDWEEYEKQANAGRISGNIFKAISGDIYYSLDS